MTNTEKEKVVTRPKMRTAAPTGYCPGCHYGIITRVICEVIEELAIGGRTIGLAGVGCIFGSMPAEIDIDFGSCPHGRAPAMATAIKRIHPGAVVFTAQGDGDLGAIGLGCFMNALIRGEKITTFFLNNAGFGMTGGQMAPTTLLGMYTTSTPEGRDAKTTGYPLHVAELAATMKGVAYSTRVSVHTPANFQRAKRAVKTAFQKQIDGIGYGVVEFLSACVPNWAMTPVECLTFIEEKMIPEYPLDEFKNVDTI
jgi:2-oxoglutarate ferredoxin oxidoreductase subunit beta